ncbi:putative AP-3 complex subunit sigma [Zalerion maritima]|uniref:AP-3 complex subunit sigma n=1 Tax=Zalerion maritima TaxID=339359 RepID=A0AAD5RVF0_9PEZI|nr:putative AP-3 complex subunit sigma [Zalerion maritima]
MIPGLANGKLGAFVHTTTPNSRSRIPNLYPISLLRLTTSRQLRFPQQIQIHPERSRSPSSKPEITMINAFLVFNGQGQPRLTKFYTQLETSIQQRLISEIFTLVSNRPSGSCNYLPLPPLLASSSTSTTSPPPSGGPLHSSSSSRIPDPPQDVPSIVTYRHYATLYFIVISTSTESPLALIDLIQVYVEALDKLFENVCELDLIFNFETLHSCLGEMINGGIVIETSLDRIVAGVRAQGTIVKRPVNEGRIGGLTGGGAGGTVSSAMGVGVWSGR